MNILLANIYKNSITTSPSRLLMANSLKLAAYNQWSYDTEGQTETERKIDNQRCRWQVLSVRLRMTIYLPPAANRPILSAIDRLILHYWSIALRWWTIARSLVRATIVRSSSLLDRQTALRCRLSTTRCRRAITTLFVLLCLQRSSTAE